MNKNIRSFEDLDILFKSHQKVLTLFSGGLDSSYLLKKLSDYKCDVTALVVNVGEQNDIEKLRFITDKFNVNLKVVDAREYFIEQSLIPAIHANAYYLGKYPISSSLSRPIIAKYAVDIAKDLDCNVILHTANQSQNSLRRLNGAIVDLGFNGYFGTPYEYSASTREDKIKELANTGLEFFQSRSLSGDANIWCREFESGILENPEKFEIREEIFEWTNQNNTVQRHCNTLSIHFSAGLPIKIDDLNGLTIESIEYLNNKVGSYAIGRYLGLEHLEFGEKVLEVREAPAAHILIDSYRHLEMAILNAETIREKINLEQLWVREAVEGRWYGKLKEACEKFINILSKTITGSVTYELKNGQAMPFSIKAEKPLYLIERDNWEIDIAKIRASRTIQMVRT